MESLIEMGFPSNACKRAMYFSDGNIEAAMNWLCSHMDDPDYNTAFEPPKQESESPKINPPSSEQLSSLPDNFKLFTAEILNTQVKMPNQASKIYKDECVLTCDTVYSPKGLFVCLKTFLSYGESIRSQIQENKVYLNIRTTRSEKTQSDEPKPKKLAIGGENGFKPDEKLWNEETQYSIVYDEKHFELDSLPNELEYLSKVADAVINSTSAEKKMEIASWKPDAPQVSKYAEDLQQLDNGVKISPDPSKWKCSRCDLCTNLWLNLTDGSLLCGRKNWDGSGGNGHALEHFNETKYPLCVKLGTITPEGADVFSYAEDEMVTDPKLAEHLAHWGIDIQKQKKTDKSLAEMELEINKSVGAEYAAIMESGESLEPAYGPGRTGIVNLGNTCYISSILQALFAMDDFKSVFGKKNEFEPEPVNNIKTQISRIGSGLIGGEYSKPISTPDGKKLNDEQMGISPGLFKSVVAQGNADFAGNQQQDASEFLLHFFDVLEKESKNGPFTSPGKNFEFQFEERLEVNKKVQYKNINETIFGIPIDESDAINQSDVEAYLKKKQDTIESGTTEPEMVRASIPFAKCLSRWAEPEAIENYKSPSDGKLYTAQRRLRFATFPKYLLLQSRRFTIGDNWQPKKLNVSLDFPDTLDLSDMRANGEQPGEQMMDTSNEPTGPTIDENLVNQLVEMGYPYHASRKALYHTSQQLEAALEWLMIHVGDLDFDSPLVVKGNEPSKQTFPPESIIMVTSMGFSEIQAQNALEATSGNVEMAIDWIFTNPELSLQPSGTNKSDPPAGSDQLTSDSSKYELVAFVSHMGTSTSCGHYVAHVKNQAKEDDQSDWIIFNDNKVAFSKSPPRDLAYLYFYRQI